MDNIKKKVLLVEDDTYIQDIYKMTLEGEGFSVDQAIDGETGLKMLSEKKYDLMLLDIMLPGINGLEVYKLYLDQNPTSNLPVIVLSNLTQEDVMKRATELGAKAYLTKASIDPFQMVQEVNKILNS